MTSFLPEYNFFSIHLESEKVRDPIIKKLQSSLGRPLTIFDATCGEDALARGYPRGHPHEKETSIGALGCLDSHIRLLYYQIKSNMSLIGIFEDDAEMHVDTEKLINFYNRVEQYDPDWDILILGANEWVDYTVEDSFMKPTRYWGTHAFLIKRNAAVKVLDTHKMLLKDGYAYPADWLYGKAIKDHNLKAYGPIDEKHFFRQAQGLVSSVNGKIRK